MSCSCETSGATAAIGAAEPACDPDALRQHLLSHHTWGIVSGLAIALNPTDGLPSVGSGVAVDGLARVLVLEASFAIDAVAFDLAGSDVLEVWLRYRREEIRPEPSDDPCATATAAGAVESAVIQLLPDGAGGDPRSPTGAAPPPVPGSPPPDPDDAWPVFLGRVKRTQGADPEYTVVPSTPPYAGVRAGEIASPAGAPKVLLGPDAKHPGVDFAVIADATAADPELALVARDLRARVPVRLERGLAVAGPIEFEGGPPPAAIPAGSWRVWRVTTPVASASADELRIQIPQFTGVTGLPNQVTVGSFDEQAPGSFRPILTVEDTGRVTVQGELIVKGALNTSLATALLTAALNNEEARALMLAATLKAQDPVLADKIKTALT